MEEAGFFVNWRFSFHKTCFPAT